MMTDMPENVTLVPIERVEVLNSRDCRTSTTLSARDNHLGRFSGR